MNPKIRHIIKSKKTIEGAGVKLKRVFGYNQVPMFDPFLLLDNFGSKNPNDYLKGFPWHPHRGIETVTYMLNGEVEHGDSMGNKGTISSGDIQWMSAGSGIIHQEMPQKYPGEMRGFQLWVNLPTKNKMTNPKYRGITKTQIPTIEKDGAKIKLIAGEINGVLGPVKDLVVDVEYFDVSLSSGKTFTHNPKADYTTFAFVFEGTAYIDKAAIKAKNCILFSPNIKTIKVEAKEGARFLFVSGKPLNEPVAWGGPIVMNTQQELDQAFQELDEGTFIKTQK
jgi:redox-sensitive bicupin YhaK (pirin superfamily)